MHIKRQITYTRAVWRQDLEPKSLRVDLERCLAQLVDVDATRVRDGDRQTAVCDRRSTHTGLFLHIAKWNARRAASTVPHVHGATLQLQRQSPGDDWDYWDGSGILMVRDNHCLLMSNGLLPRTIESYVRKLLVRGNHGTLEAGAFRLVAVADRSILETVREKGIKQINLHLSDYLEAADTLGSRPTVMGRIGGAVGALLLQDHTRERIREASNVNVNLAVRIDGRRRPGFTPQHLSPVVEQILEDNDEASIDLETADGQVYRRGNLIRRKRVDVALSPNTTAANHRHAWQLMEEFMNELYMAGELD